MVNFLLENTWFEKKNDFACVTSANLKPRVTILKLERKRKRISELALELLFTRKRGMLLSKV